MKGEIHYRESWPKELRIQIENQDEMDMLRLMFMNSIEGNLKRYKETDLREIGKDNSWKKKVSNESLTSDYGEAYCTAHIWETLEEEQRNTVLLD